MKPLKHWRQRREPEVPARLPRPDMTERIEALSAHYAALGLVGKQGNGHYGCLGGKPKAAANGGGGGGRAR